MGFYFHRIPSYITSLFPGHVWNCPNNEKKVYITFDDGPTPEITAYILNLLAREQALATFFCLGQQVAKYPDLVRKIEAQKHLLANHGYRHLDGWRISEKAYLDNIEKGELEINHILGDRRRLFRAPHGHFRIGNNTIMWSLMSGDFDRKLTKEKCLSRLISKTRAGDIVVFHDNEKSFGKLKWVLPRYLKFCVQNGFQFDLIKPNK